MSKMGVSEGGNLLIKAYNTPQSMHTAVDSLPQISAVFIESQMWWPVTKAVYEVMSWIMLVNQHYYLMLTKAMVGVLSLCCFKWKTYIMVKLKKKKIHCFKTCFNYDFEEKWRSEIESNTNISWQQLIFFWRKRTHFLDQVLCNCAIVLGLYVLFISRGGISHIIIVVIHSLCCYGLNGNLSVVIMQ